MRRTGLLAVLLFTATLFLLAGLLPEEKTVPLTHTPWEVMLNAEGDSQLLGITLGKSRLSEAQLIWREQAEITLFLPREAPAKVEAYFQQINLGGIRASLVTEVQVEELRLQQIIDQGARISTQGDGSRKITLDGEGVTIVEESPIVSLTYLPRSNLSTETLQNRFGPPAETLLMATGTEHWLYPRIGLDIAISGQGREVFQFVPPHQFDRLRIPLQSEGREGDAPES
ncbi:MAG: hypothetical protein HN842_00320 [Gammaproteobacteria bacterium]|jgi:hypothetical protein|nr:hypothetical protein [Gammaproteobacteria bacterium]MBT7306625.1 hypothetical protein [Gammaproteobacteria bacterium]